MLRICRRNGWSIEQDWDALSEWEQTQWLGYDLWIEERLGELTDGYTKREGLYTPEVHALLSLQRL